MPGGRVDVEATCHNGKCVSVRLKNVPAFVFKLDAPLEVAGQKTMPVDIAYGGMIFAMTDARALGFAVTPDEARDLAVLGEKIRLAARAQHSVVHPESPAIKDVSIVQFQGPFNGPNQPARNTVIVAPGRSDRSPCGTGTSARLAALHARGLLQVGEGLVHESLIGSQFSGRIVGTTRVGDRPAIETTLEGRAWITGFHQYVVERSDPWQDGYRLSDTWGTSNTATQG